MMTKKILATLLIASCSMSAWSRIWNIIPTDVNYTVRLGYNIGGTAPLGMPATIRKMNKFKIQPNFTLGFDVQKDFWGKWGIQTGLHVETKGMEVDATVKNYHMEMEQGGQSLEGNFTGNVVTKVDEQMLTLPILATFKPKENITLKLGPYVSYLSTRTFKGDAYNGYLRQDDPTGPKMNIGMDGATPATFDFSDHMRSIQIGIDLGIDWLIYRRWGVYGDINWGLNGIHKSSFKTIEQTLYPIYGSLGLTYKLK